MTENYVGIEATVSHSKITKESIMENYKASNVVRDNKTLDFSIIDAIEDPVGKATEEGVCTFIYTRARFYPHKIAYTCHSCKLDTVCQMCIEREHQDCKLEKLSEYDGYCFWYCFFLFSLIKNILVSDCFHDISSNCKFRPNHDSD